LNDETKKQIIQSLTDQKEIFGDFLFEEKFDKKENIIHNPLDRKTQVEKIEMAEEESLFDEKEEWQKAKSLDEVYSLIKDCTKCRLYKSRNKFVFGVGNPNADVLVVGEGPGAEEDKQGEPFVGRAGMLLNDILKAIKFEREEVYIANIVKSRPPNNRTPLPDEMETCLPYLLKQIELIQPKLILCLGLTAAKGLLKKKESLTKLRGNWYEFANAKVMVTFHPAALLRNPHWKKDCWEDMKKFKKMYDEIVNK
jgi:uracil-DNA glycosylase